jgi:predicted nuclease of predicted toxin-antitoxin system
VVQALRAAGETAHAHDDHFAVDAPDTEWLADATRRGWVVLTNDKNIRRNEIERLTIVDTGAACFMLGRGDLTGATVSTLARVYQEGDTFDYALGFESVDGGVPVVNDAGDYVYTCDATVP